jgi:hypothetical protein
VEEGTETDEEDEAIQEQAVEESEADQTDSTEDNARAAKIISDSKQPSQSF